MPLPSSIALTRRGFLAGGLAATALPIGAQGSEPARIERLSPALDRTVAPGARVEEIASGIA